MRDRSEGRLLLLCSRCTESRGIFFAEKIPLTQMAIDLKEYSVLSSGTQAYPHESDDRSMIVATP
jgi:hypothetical protein